MLTRMVKTTTSTIFTAVLFVMLAVSGANAQKSNAQTGVSRQSAQASEARETPVVLAAVRKANSGTKKQLRRNLRSNATTKLCSTKLLSSNSQTV